MKYRKLPIEIEAFQYDGDLENSNGNYYVPDWAVEAYEDGTMYFDSIDREPCELFIKTLEGNHHVSVGDYVIQGVQGELYPCKPDIFLKTYEPVKVCEPANYRVVTLCGSTKFKEEFMKAQRDLTLIGNIVLSVGVFGHSDKCQGKLTKETKTMLDNMHKRKIDMSNAIYVINKGGYIGPSTMSEIEYAEEHHKIVIYMFKEFLEE